MNKYAIVGLERIGKTSLIHSICYMLGEAGVEYLMIPEITMLSPSLDLDNENVQLGLFFQQLVNECFITSTNYKDIYITDRTIIDIIPYIATTKNSYPKVPEYIERLAIAWSKTFKRIYHVMGPHAQKEGIKLNRHYTEEDQKHRPTRYHYLTWMLDRIKKAGHTEVLEVDIRNFNLASTVIGMNIINDFKPKDEEATSTQNVEK